MLSIFVISSSKRIFGGLCDLQKSHQFVSRTWPGPLLAAAESLSSNLGDSRGSTRRKGYFINSIIGGGEKCIQQIRYAI